MSYYYGENAVLLPPFHIITATGLSGGVFHGEILRKNRNDIAGDSVYVCGTHILN
ncbi:hypothetical protein TH47_17430 [Thalassospira sp. MCCC 1A02803]|nr:hypothetical protein TH47_17430 [Thalassospira sp. MCCC 1A02803]